MATLLPRATTFLRSLQTREHQLDVEKEFVKRRLSGKGASTSATTFSESIIGPRHAADKEQREALDAFLAACKRLAGGACGESLPSLCQADTSA